MKWQNLDAVARVLLAGADIERQDGRREREGDAVFVPVEDIRVRLKTVRGIKYRAEIAEALRLLVQLRVLDAFPGSGVRAHVGQRYDDAWKQTVDAAVKHLLLRAAVEAGGTNAGNLVESLVNSHEALDPERRLFGEGRWSVSAGRLKADILGVVRGGGQSWGAAVDAWLRFVGGVNAFWFARSPSYIYLVDVPLLRAVVFEEDDVGDLLVGRVRALNLRPGKLPPSFDVLTATTWAHEPGRLVRYVRRATRFFLAHLDGAATLHFTGTGEGYVSADAKWPPHLARARAG